jgi:D-inositol-3-phosphate glycosyltransferase
MSNEPVTKSIVVQICFSTAWGGLEMSTLKMARLFRESGSESWVACRVNSPIHQEALKLELKTITFDQVGYFAPASIFKLRKFLKNEKVMSIYAHHLRDLWIISPALIGLRHIKLVGFARMFLKNVRKKDFLHRWIYSRLNTMIALSQIQKKYLLDCLPVAERKYRVIPNGVDTKKFSPLQNQKSRKELRSAWGFLDDQVVFGLIGRIDIQKGQWEFVQAAHRTYQDHPNARFLMVGHETADQGGFSRKIVSFLFQAKLEEIVKVQGHSSNIAEIMQAIDVFVMPSYEENFANVMLEAMSCGIACMGTNAGGTPEILDFGKAGLLFNPRDHVDLSKVMNALAISPALRLEYAEKARKRALEVYDLGRVFHQIESLSKPV